MVYGVLAMINFAHGDLFMLGAFACLLITALVPLPFPLVLVLVMLCIGLLGALIERLAYRPLRAAPRVSAIITALGCGLVIENTTLSLSPYSRRMPALIDNTTWQLGGVAVSSLQLLILAVAAALLVGLDLLVRRTPFGMAMRAISFDARTAPLLGIPVDRVISLTFLVGAGLGGAAGMLYGLSYPVISAGMGILVGWKAFVAAVIGGIGSIRGAVLGGFILGAIEVSTVAVLPSTYRDLVAYSLLLLILLVKPYGLLGAAPSQKV
jgi:branched-chain amino acid transport system permease protein